jgi:hypothetical protein
MAPQPKFAYTLAEFQRLGGPCKVKAYALRNAGELTFVYRNGRALILYAEAERYFASLPTENSAASRANGQRRKAQREVRP